MLNQLTDMTIADIKKYVEPNYRLYLIEWLNTDSVRVMLNIPAYK